MQICKNIGYTIKSSGTKIAIFNWHPSWLAMVWTGIPHGGLGKFYLCAPSESCEAPPTLLEQQARNVNPGISPLAGARQWAGQAITPEEVEWRILRPLRNWNGCEFGVANFLHYNVGPYIISIAFNGNDFTIYYGLSTMSVSDDAEAFASTLRGLIENNECSGRTELSMVDNPEFFARRCMRTLPTQDPDEDRIEPDKNFIHKNIWNVLRHSAKWGCPHSLICEFNGMEVAFSYDHSSDEYLMDSADGTRLRFPNNEATVGIAENIQRYHEAS